LSKRGKSRFIRTRGDCGFKFPFLQRGKLALPTRGDWV